MIKVASSCPQKPFHKRVFGQSLRLRPMADQLWTRQPQVPEWAVVRVRDPSLIRQCFTVLGSLGRSPTRMVLAVIMTHSWRVSVEVITCYDTVYPPRFSEATERYPGCLFLI